jgi:hypothetical protein
MCVSVSIIAHNQSFMDIKQPYMTFKCVYLHAAIPGEGN